MIGFLRNTFLLLVLAWALIIVVRIVTPRCDAMVQQCQQVLR